MGDSPPTRKDPWPSCPDPDTLFGTCILLVSPFPPEGWSVIRAPKGSAIYIAPRGWSAHEAVRVITEFFYDVVSRHYEHRRWSDKHRWKVAQKWKNEFLLWVWEVRDES